MVAIEDPNPIEVIPALAKAYPPIVVTESGTTSAPIWLFANAYVPMDWSPDPRSSDVIAFCRNACDPTEVTESGRSTRLSRRPS